MALSDKRPPQMFPEFHKCPPGGLTGKMLPTLQVRAKFGSSEDQGRIRMDLGPSKDQLRNNFGTAYGQHKSKFTQVKSNKIKLNKVNYLNVKTKLIVC